MNYRTLFFLFFFGLFGLTTTSFAGDPILKEVTVFQGGFLDFKIPCTSGAPIQKTPPVEGTTIEELGSDESYFYYKYIPDPSYLGADGFTYEVIQGDLPPSSQLYVFQIQVVASTVDSKDDFVHLLSADPIDIDVLTNDETSSTDLTVTIAQVLRGAAVVNDDQTITYTPPADSDADDYIVYTLTDQFNTISTSVVYISYEVEAVEELTERSYSIASGKTEYILLPNSGFVLDDETYEFGSLTQINDFVYEYSSNTEAAGMEVVNFTDDEGNVFRANIEIIEKYYDIGYVRDDVFYSASNTNAKFNVTLNDVVDQYVIADYSEELMHLGQGVFSYTPPPYFTGVKNFFYTADDGFTEETGTIELVINNYKPTNYFEYNLATPQNQPRVIEYDVPLGTEYFEIASLPTFGTVEIFTEEESVDVACEEGLQKVFVLYTPDNDYVGLDNLTIRYCASDNNLCNDVDIQLDVVETTEDECICVDDCVWPGDANGDGKVSVVDALSIGRYMGSGGTTREDAPFEGIYDGADSEDWLEFQVNGKNVKHADTNGDGFITIEDMDAVIDNYGAINSVISNDVLGIKNVPFLLTTTQTDLDSGDLLVIYVTIGSQAYPAIDIQGVSFAVNLPASLVDSSTVEVEYLEDAYMVRGAPYVSLTHQPVDGIIHTAGLKTNSAGSTGYGLVATVSFIVEEDAEGIKEPGGRSVSSSYEDVIATIRATDIIIEDSRGYKYALPNTSLDIQVNSGEDQSELTLEEVSIYPNPANTEVTMSSTNGAEITSIQVYSLEGSLVKSINRINSRNATMDIADLEKGLYIVKTSNENSTYTTKLVKN